MGKTLSFGKGKGNIKHNNRDYETENVDHDRIKNNVYLVQQPIEDAYKECYGQAIDDYNAKQKRADRKKSIPDYMDEIKRNQANRNGEKLFYEQVIGIGDMHDSGILTHPEDAQRCKEILLEYFSEWKERNPNLHVFNAVLHMDEQTPHLHIDYIPIGRGYKQGIQARNSLTRAFEDMGIDSAKSKDDNATIHWQTRERTRITEIAKEYGIEIDTIGIKRDDYSISDYKALVRDERQKLKQVKAIEPKRINLPFGMALETDRESIDKELERKAGMQKHAETYKQATKQAENATEHATKSVKAIKGIELSLGKQKADLERLKRSAEQEKEKALAELQVEKEKYIRAYNKQLDLNKAYQELYEKSREREQDMNELMMKNINLRAENSDLRNSIDECIEKAVEPFKERIKALEDKVLNMAKGQLGIMQAIRYVRDFFSGEVGGRLLNATLAAGNQWFKEDGFEEYSKNRDLSISKTIRSYVEMNLIYKNGDEGKGVYTDKDVCVFKANSLREARELLPNCKIRDGVSRGYER